MIVKVEETRLMQKCKCGEVNPLNYKDLAISGNFIYLPICSSCNASLEVLHLNNKDDDHSLMVTKVFAKVATA